MSKSKLGILLLALLCLCLSSCHKNEDISIKRHKEIKIAVILPSYVGVEWQHVLSYVQENIMFANDSIMPVYEIYDEDIIDIQETAKELTTREDIIAIIGCMYSQNTQTLAYYASKTKKPIFTFSTSETLARAYGEKGFLYMLAESDVTQMELLLIKAERYGAKKVALLTREDDIYGKTFLDWFAFQAVELGMRPTNSIEYTTDNIAESVAIAAQNTDYLICAPSSVNDAITIAQESIKQEVMCRLLFSDTAYNPAFIDILSERGNGIEGVSIVDDPESGFRIAYKAKYGAEPSYEEAFVYDAVMSICYAERYRTVHNDITINEAIQTLLQQKTTEKGMWTELAMRDIFRQIEQKDTPAFSGASSSLDFSPATSTIQYSTYTHWAVYDKEFIQLDYDVRSEYGNSTAYAAWEWNKKFMQEFDNSDVSNVIYEPLEDNYAIIIAASDSWMNYRHQADALVFYQLLKHRGYDDDHILFIAEDDIAYHRNNPNQGVVVHTEDGENQYIDVEIDYILSEVSHNKLQELLLQLPTTDRDNILFFWSGHGYHANVMWGDSEFPFADLAETFQGMWQLKKYRKMICFVETCYSGSLGKAIEGIPGILVMTAANSEETSKTYLYSIKMATWLTNRFTFSLLQQLNDNPHVGLKELYLRLFKEVLGSHVTVYNANNYGNIYTNTMQEYLK